jgi:hypothetical protein
VAKAGNELSSTFIDASSNADIPACNQQGDRLSRDTQSQQECSYHASVVWSDLLIRVPQRVKVSFDVYAN